MNDRLISVIVTVYNVEKYLNKCIESIVSQTYRELEIILIDDGSNDKSGIICDKWGKTDPRIHVFHKQNGGVSSARNYGLKVANGKWVGFVDGDDFVSISMYDILFKNRIQNGICVCGYFIVENNKIIPVSGINKTLTQREAVELYLTNERYAILNGHFTYFGAYVCNKLYDIAVFNNITFPPNKEYEDMYIMLELIHQSREIRIISDCEYYYIQRKNSITHQEPIQTDFLDARLKQKKELKKFWNIEDKKIDDLIVLSYIAILRKYAINPRSERIKYSSVKNKIWDSLKSSGYNQFPFKIKLKLLLLHIPSIYYFLYCLKEKIKF